MITIAMPRLKMPRTATFWSHVVGRKKARKEQRKTKEEHQKDAEDDALLRYSLRPHRSLNVRLSDNRTMVYEPFPRQYRPPISGIGWEELQTSFGARAAPCGGKPLDRRSFFKRRLHRGPGTTA
jgi:hypothetical protein